MRFSQTPKRGTAENFVQFWGCGGRTQWVCPYLACIILTLSYSFDPGVWMPGRVHQRVASTAGSLQQDCTAIVRPHALVGYPYGDAQQPVHDLPRYLSCLLPALQRSEHGIFAKRRRQLRFHDHVLDLVRPFLMIASVGLNSHTNSIGVSTTSS